MAKSPKKRIYDEPVHSGWIADRLRNQKERIIDIWCKRLREETDRGEEVSDLILTDTLPLFLDRLAGAFDTKNRGRLEVVATTGRIHGDERLKHRFSLNVVLKEYAILRQILFEVLEEENPLKAQERDCILGVIQNATRHAALQHTEEDQKELKQSQERYRQLAQELEQEKRTMDTILSNHPDFMYIFDTDQRCVYANRSLLQLWGKSLSEVIGKNFEDLGYSTELVELHKSQFEEVLRTQRPVRGDTSFTDRDGITRYYEYLFVPVPRKDGQIQLITGTTRDITSRKLLEESLRKAVQQRERTLAVVSHDLRNPLGAILVNAALLEKHFKHMNGGESLLKITERIRSCGLQMNRLIEDLLNLAQMSTGKFKVEKSIRSVKDLLQEVFQAMQPLARGKGIRLHVDSPEHDLKWNLDQDRIMRVFSNLIGNAIKFIPEGGSVSFGGESIGKEEICFHVSDNGPGIPSDQLSNLFEAYWQAGLPGQKGIGLGLSIAKGVVEAHGGRIWVKSEFGKGSSFYFSLPK